GRGDAERSREPPREEGLARAELALEPDHVSDTEVRRERGGELAGGAAALEREREHARGLPRRRAKSKRRSPEATIGAVIRWTVTGAGPPLLVLPGAACGPASF